MSRDRKEVEIFEKEFAKEIAEVEEKGIPSLKETLALAKELNEKLSREKAIKKIIERADELHW